MKDRKVTPYYIKGRRVIQTDSDESSGDESENKIVDIQMQVP